MDYIKANREYIDRIAGISYHLNDNKKSDNVRKSIVRRNQTLKIHAIICGVDPKQLLTKKYKI